MPFPVSSLIACSFFDRCVNPNAAQHIRRLGELDVVVEKWAGQRLDPRIGQRLADGILVVDNKPKVTSFVSRLSSAFLPCEELVAQIDKGRSAGFAPKLEVEQLPVED